MDVKYYLSQFYLWIHVHVNLQLQAIYTIPGSTFKLVKLFINSSFSRFTFNQILATELKVQCYNWTECM